MQPFFPLPPHTHIQVRVQEQVPPEGKKKVNMEADGITDFLRCIIARGSGGRARV